MKYVFVGAAMIGSLASGGCWGPCGLVDYEKGLVVEVAHTPGAGAYRLDLHADGERLIVDYAVSDDGVVSCAGGCDAESPRFVVEASHILGGVPQLSADSLRFAVRQHGEQRGPDHLEVLVLRDQTVVFDDSFAIEYRTDEPNGEGCGEQTFGHVTVDLGAAP